MEFSLTSEEKKLLLAVARNEIAAQFNASDEAEAARLDAAGTASKNLTAWCGAFVTLHLHGKLRGCIGNMVGRMALYQTVKHMALAAAFEDHRFAPLSKQELTECEIEISVLSPLVPCPDPETVVVGKHGLYLVHRNRSGVLLPQVPEEQGWNRQEYLDYICVKAGLPPASYKEPGAQLYTFTATVFAEER